MRWHHAETLPGARVSLDGAALTVPGLPWGEIGPGAGCGEAAGYQLCLTSSRRSLPPHRKSPWTPASERGRPRVTTGVVCLTHPRGPHVVFLELLRMSGRHFKNLENLHRNPDF